LPHAGLRFLSDDDTSALLKWPEVIGAVRRAYESVRSAASAPPRVLARGNGVWLRALAAVAPSGTVMGAKVFGKSRSTQASYLIALWSQETAELRALIDAQHVTALRTAATSAVAVDKLCSRQEIDVAVLGAGAEATGHVEALAQVRKIRRMTVFSPTPKSREAFASKFAQQLGIEVKAVQTAESAVEGANVVVAAARSKDETPILKGAWLRPGMVVVSIGSTIPEQREVDVDVISRSDLIVADVPEEVVHETGDCLEAQRAGVEFESKIHALADLVQGRVTLGGDEQIRLYKSVGSSLQDIAVAELCLNNAEKENRGTLLPASLSLKHGRK
jgi:ornithine cyclodeaminase/alanine dehydrogenase